MNFLDNLNTIRDKDDEIHNIIEGSFADLIDQVMKSHFPLTGRALIMLEANTNFIKNSIFDVCENEDLYSANILFRSLIEHFLKHQYLFMYFVKNNDDSVGNDYFKYCDMDESLQYLKSLIKNKKIFDPDFIETDTWQLLISLDPRFKDCDPKKLEGKNNQFKYRKIVGSIVGMLGLKNGGFIEKIIPIYSELSSFIHGGPYASSILIQNQPDDIRSKSLINICELTFLIAQAIKSSTYMFASRINNKFITEQQKIDNIKITP